jgi:hypothetical protein
LSYPEPYLDNNYSREKIVLTKDKNKINKLMERNHKLIDIINSYATLKTQLNKEQIDNIVETIVDLMNKKHMNYTAFAKYFLVHDVSYSSYKKCTRKKQKIIIYHMLNTYVEHRHFMYKSHGYSDSILQIISDVHSHKRRSVSGKDKVVAQLKEKGILHYNKVNNSKKDNYYILPDFQDNLQFIDILKKHDIDLRWKLDKQNKNPDFLIMLNNKPIIIEHKHMKENGGGQDKQSNEIIDFIKYSEENAKLVTYLDGIYFNQLISDTQNNYNFNDVKIEIQSNDIIKALKNNPNNYFLNTKGFERFISDQLKQ